VSGLAILARACTGDVFKFSGWAGRARVIRIKINEGAVGVDLQVCEHARIRDAHARVRARARALVSACVLVRRGAHRAV